ncbi:hypothetical protein [Variibacter gotjawalensis]|uniref:hypothetical protein n=1 Tax=Variibacter gotjawalensis TaxID=1333996 RepID=UPI00102B9456|nr:hypothetical protein [Variibacter gotjawalensis]NIK47875.1 hypothetical protein [Variibacter gotjawalensis]
MTRAAAVDVLMSQANCLAEAERCEGYAALSLNDDKEPWLALAARWRILAAKIAQPALKNFASIRSHSPIPLQ